MKVVSADRKNRGMTLKSIRAFMNTATTGRIATISPNGTPYIVPVYFVLEDDRIYIHCSPEGKKLDHIQANPAVCFEADEEVEQVIVPEKPCKSNTYYRSVIATGKATIVEDPDQKARIISALTAKFSRGQRMGKIPADAVERTCVIEIMVDEISGKALLPEK
ncbi:MAG TPA: pyridoxamine 5'-phosphate oxidase family protein [Methanocella sp.]|nr:pyridoxamine 5'-phosphate oxidase family protein [Methanocella sp.]